MKSSRHDSRAGVALQFPWSFLHRPGLSHQLLNRRCLKQKAQIQAKILPTIRIRVQRQATAVKASPKNMRSQRKNSESHGTPPPEKREN